MSPAALMLTTRISSDVGGIGAAGWGGGGGCCSRVGAPGCRRCSRARASSVISAPRIGSSRLQYNAAKGTSLARLDPKPAPKIQGRRGK